MKLNCNRFAIFPVMCGCLCIGELTCGILYPAGIGKKIFADNAF